MSVEKIVVRNPATLEEVGEADITPISGLDEMVLRARNVQSEWSATSFTKRLRLFRRLRRYIWRNHENLVKVVHSETGKVWPDAMEEIASPMLMIRHILRNGPAIAEEDLRKNAPEKPLLLENYKCGIESAAEVVGIIAPFNLVWDIPTADLFPAIFKGKAVVLKPSEHTPLAARALKEAMERVGFPKDLLQVAVGYGDLGAALCEVADSIIFTGSAAVGRKVKAVCDRREIFCGLEMSGIAPFIVLEDADLELAANAAGYGLVGNLAQYCKAPRHGIVAKSVYDEFVGLLLRKVSAMRDGVDYGPFIAEFQRSKVEAQVEDARLKEADIAIGGLRISSRENGYWYRPTVILEANDTMRVMQEEVFGPVLTLTSFDDTDEAIQFANKFSQGLNGYIFTRNEKLFHELRKKLLVGNAVGNDIYANWLIKTLPQCGVRGATLHTSGLPRHGRTGFDRFDHPFRTWTFRDHPFWRIPAFKRTNPWWPPYNDFTTLALKAFLGYLRYS